jgi:hypothetical protein
LSKRRGRRYTGDADQRAHGSSDEGGACKTSFVGSASAVFRSQNSEFRIGTLSRATCTNILTPEFCILTSLLQTPQRGFARASRNRNRNLNPPTLADPTRRRLPAHAHDQGMCCGSIRVYNHMHGQSTITIMITNQRPHQNYHAPPSNSNYGSRYRDPNRDRDRNRRESKEFDPDSDFDFDCTDVP